MKCVNPPNRNTPSPIERAPLKDSDRAIRRETPLIKGSSNVNLGELPPVTSTSSHQKPGLGTWVMLIISVLLLIEGLNMMYDDDDKPQQQTEDEYISSCKVYDYESLLRNPDGYSGELAVFSGVIVQTVEGWFDTVQLRVDIGDDRVIYVSYKMKDGEYRHLEGDQITVYGELTGLMTYTAVLGNQVSIPSLSAKYIINKE